MQISTHTPVRVWRTHDRMRPCYQDFNSHTREGVTTRYRRKGTPLQDFNSHTREGVTSYKLLWGSNEQWFQLIWYQRILLRIIATFKHIKCYLVCRKCVCGKICFLKNTPLWNSCWKTHHHTKNTPSEVCRSFTNNNNWDKTHLPNHLTKSWDWFIHWFWYICISIFLSKKNKRPPKWSLILLFCCLFKHPWICLLYTSDAADD